MVARVLALLAAVAMVAGALAVRSRMDESDERTSTALRLVCATELTAVCDALAEQESNVETTVEPAGATADQLIGLEPGEQPDFDGWLVTAPWPAMVEQTRAREAAGPLVKAGPVLGRSPVVLAVRADRNVVLTNQCGGPPGWKCVGEVAGKPWLELPGGRAEWQAVKPGHPPLSGAAGLTVLGGATVGFFGRSSDLSSADLNDGAFQSWLRRLEDAVPTRPDSPIETMLQRPSAFDAVGALEAEAGPLLVTARAPKPTLLYPSPVVTADVVLAGSSGRASDLLADLVSGASGRRVLAEAGWRVSGEKPVPGIQSTALPSTSGLPDPDVLQALRAEAEEAIPK